MFSPLTYDIMSQNMKAPFSMRNGYHEFCLKIGTPSYTKDIGAVWYRTFFTSEVSENMPVEREWVPLAECWGAICHVLFSSFSVCYTRTMILRTNVSFLNGFHYRHIPEYNCYVNWVYVIYSLLQFVRAAENITSLQRKHFCAIMWHIIIKISFHFILKTFQLRNITEHDCWEVAAYS